MTHWYCDDCKLDLRAYVTKPIQCPTCGSHNIRSCMENDLPPASSGTPMPKCKPPKDAHSCDTCHWETEYDDNTGRDPCNTCAEGERDNWKPKTAITPKQKCKPSPKEHDEIAICTNPPSQRVYLFSMSLRDYFAGQALIGIMVGGHVTQAEAADIAYRYADGMLEHRKKEGKTQ